MTVPKKQGGQAVRRSTLVVTNSIKVGGLALALNEVLVRGTPRTVELLVAAFMMTGAQVSEEVLLGIASRFFGFQREGRRPGEDE